MLKTFSGRKASQHSAEIKGLTDLFAREGVRSYLEIGARHGDTFHHVMTSLPVGSVGIAVDLPGGAWGQTSSQASLIKAVEDLRRGGYRVGYVLGDSTSSEAWAEVGQVHADLIGGEPRGFDAILIDGDHRYDGVSADWRIWGRSAPLVAFHDIAGEGVRQKTTGDPVEVPRLWRELKESLPLDVSKLEFVGEGSAMGIGVLCHPRRAS